MVNYHSDPDQGQPGVDEMTVEVGPPVEVQADVSIAADVSRLFDQIVARVGEIDVLVFNPGIEMKTPFLGLSEADCIWL